MTVQPAQIAAAATKMINVDHLAAACDRWGCPFWVACIILEKETRGRNIYGHDVGGIFTVPWPQTVEVTEANYAEFLRRLAAGERSNGVGPMQLTWVGYHIGPASMTARGYRAWLPADNMAYGVEILARSWRNAKTAGKSDRDALWSVAKAYNGGSAYADDAVARMPGWLALVGDADTKPEEEMPTAQEVVAELLKPENVEKLAAALLATPANRKRIAQAVWDTDDVIQSPAAVVSSDPFTKGRNVLVRIADAADAVKKKLGA